MIEYFLNSQSIEALGWTLLHSLWQGAAFAFLLVIILIALRRYSALSRYVVSVGLLCAFFLTLTGTFWLQLQEANSRFGLAMQQLSTQPTDAAFLLNDNVARELELYKKTKSTIPNNIDILGDSQSTWLVEFSNYYDRHLPLLVTIWLIGILFLQLRFLGQLVYVQRLKHYGAQLFPTTWSDKIEQLEGKLRIRKKVGYLTSIRIESPMVIGWLKPVVLLPQQLFNNLTETEVYAVLAHELAHIRREDFIVNLMQTFLCNVFFFHPGVWWMSNRIDDEREHCCDDLAVTATGMATSYAKTLINVSEYQLKMQKNTPLVMAFSGKSKRREHGGFSGRIQRLFMVSNGVGTFREGFATAFILITALFLGVAATGSTAQNAESASQLKIDKTEIISENEIPNKIELKQRIEEPALSTTMKVEMNPISKINQGLDLSVFPVADPEKPVVTAKPVGSDKSRVDALVMACREGDIDFVKTLINSGIDINGIGSKGFTPLMMASSKQEPEIVDYLLTQGADVNQIYNGWTALLETADEGSLLCMKHLLKAGAEVNFFWTIESPTAIGIAASEGNLDCLQLLLDNGADINGIGNSVPPLHLAAEENKRAIIDYLLSQEVNINKRDAAGRTALMYAASEGNVYSVKRLIEAGADILIVDVNGANARDYALEESENEILDIIEDENKNHSGNKEEEEDFKMQDFKSVENIPEIHQATIDGLIEKVQRMVEQGTDVNTIDDYGRTALHFASAKNHNIDMGVLINLGADIDAQDRHGRTPLMYAAADGKRGAVVLLVSRQADVNIKDIDGMRAYDWSQSGGNSKLTNFLGLITESKKRVDNKFNRSSKQSKKSKREQEKESRREVGKSRKLEIKKRELDHDTENSFYLRHFDVSESIPKLLEAARNGSVEECSNLLSNGLAVNASDDTGQTALMVAARSNRIDIAKFLIEQGADVNMNSTSGLTALHYSALENYAQMAQLLLNNNSKVDAIMRYSSTDGNYGTEPLVWEYIGATPLLIAIESGNTEVVSVLLDAGANTKHLLVRNEYRLNKNRVTYLSGSEVMGLDVDFLKEVEFQTSDDAWTPYKQALLLNKPEILVLFQK